MSCLWKQFPDEMLHRKTFPKKHQFFLPQVGDLKISDIFYNIQNFNGWPVFSSNHSLDLYLAKCLGHTLMYLNLPEFTRIYLNLSEFIGIYLILSEFT